MPLTYRQDILSENNLNELLGMFRGNLAIMNDKLLSADQKEVLTALFHWIQRIKEKTILTPDAKEVKYTFYRVAEDLFDMAYILKKGNSPSLNKFLEVLQFIYPNFNLEAFEGEKNEGEKKSKKYNYCLIYWSANNWKEMVSEFREPDAEWIKAQVGKATVLPALQARIRKLEKDDIDKISTDNMVLRKTTKQVLEHENPRDFPGQRFSLFHVTYEGAEGEHATNYSTPNGDGVLVGNNEIRDGYLQAMGITPVGDLIAFKYGVTGQMYTGGLVCTYSDRPGTAYWNSDLFKPNAYAQVIYGEVFQFTPSEKLYENNPVISLYKGRKGKLQWLDNSPKPSVSLQPLSDEKKVVPSLMSSSQSSSSSSSSSSNSSTSPHSSTFSTISASLSSSASSSPSSSIAQLSLPVDNDEKKKKSDNDTSPNSFSFASQGQSSSQFSQKPIVSTKNLDEFKRLIKTMNDEYGYRFSLSLEAQKCVLTLANPGEVVALSTKNQVTQQLAKLSQSLKNCISDQSISLEDGSILFKPNLKEWTWTIEAKPEILEQVKQLLRTAEEFVREPSAEEATCRLQ